MTATTVAARRTRGLDRFQTLGVIFGILGVMLVGYVAPNLDDATKSFTLEQPPEPAEISFSPRTLVVAIGVFYILTAIATFVIGRSAQWGRYARAGLMVSALLLAPLVVILSLSWSEAQSTNIVQLIVESLRLGTPIALGAMAGLWSERSGVVNIGIEGMMLGAAGVGFTVYAVLGDAQDPTWLWIGIGAAVLTGGLIGALHSLVSVTFRVDQIISGVVINLLALGLTSFLRSQVIVPREISTGVSTSEISIPLLSDIPVVGDQLFTNKPIFFAMFVIVAATWFVLFRTPWGLRVRSCGENPHAAETLGIDVISIRYQAGDPGRADRRPRRDVVLARGPGRLPGQHDQRRRLHRPGRPDLRALAPVGAFAGGHALRLLRGARHAAADPRVTIGDFRSPASSGRCCPTS